MCALTAASHAQLQWDPALTPATPSGGNGTWNAANANWSNGAVDSTWNSAAAVFGAPGGAVTVSGTQNATGLTFSSTGYTLSNGTINLTGAPVISGSSATINSVVNGSAGFTYGGSGTLIFGGAGSTLSGTVSQTAPSVGATIRVTQADALGTANLSFNGGSFQIVSSTSRSVANNISSVGVTTINAQAGSHTLTGTITPTSGQVLYDITAGATLTLSGSAGLAQTGSTAQKTTGTGALIINATGGTALSAFLLRHGTLQVNNVSNPFGSGGGNVQIGGVASQNPILALNGANLNVTAFIDAAATSRSITNIAVGGSSVISNINFQGTTTLNLASIANSTLTVNSILDNAFTGAISIGSVATPNVGTVAMNAATTYKGGTTVNSGTLRVNNASGSATGTAGVTVASGATLGGAGFIGGAVTVNGIIAPGNSIGTLNVANDVTWSGAGLASASTDWKFELGAANAADLLNITGTGSDFLKGSGTVFRFDFQGSTAAGTFTLVDWVGTSNFSIGDFSYTNLGAGNSGTFGFNNSQLEFTSVPEPSAAFMLLFGALSVGLLVRNRRRSAANASR